MIKITNDNKFRIQLVSTIANNSPFLLILLPHLFGLWFALTICLMPLTGHAKVATQESRIRAEVSHGLNLPFIVNNGQLDPSVGYYAQTFAGPLYITKSGELVYSLPPSKTGGRGWTLVERFEQGSAAPKGSDLNTSQVSYITDHDGKAVTQSSKTFGAITLGEVFPGIKIDLRIRGDSVEKIYTLEPGADPARIRMGMIGAESLNLDSEGSLIAMTGNGPVKFSAPIAYQQNSGKKMPVKVRYTVEKEFYSYTLGDYDRSLPVIIDPLIQATYLGGNGTEFPIDIAIHPITGDVYVFGRTTHPGVGFSNTFPGTAGGWQTNQDATNKSGEATYFLARLTSDLTTLLQATYFETNSKWRIDIDTGEPKFFIHGGNGDVYIWGIRTRDDDIPGMQNAALTIDGSPYPAPTNGYRAYFASRFSADLTQLKQSTDLGIAQTDANQISLRDGIFHSLNGDLYFTGNKKGRFLILRVAENLQSYVSEKTLGINYYSSGEAIAIDHGTGDIFVAGTAQDVGGLPALPSTIGSYQPHNNSVPANGIENDGFVARIPEDLSTVKQATYFGGTIRDEIYKISIEPSGENIYLRGYTNSNDLPGLVGGAHPQPPIYTTSVLSTFFTRMSSDLTTVSQTTMAAYAGTSDHDHVGSTDMYLHPTTGDLYAIGNFSLTGQLNGSPSVERYPADLNSTYGGKPLIIVNMGGYGTNYTFSPQNGELYVLGSQIKLSTQANYLTFPSTAGGFQPSPQTDVGGNPDVFIARYSLSNTVSTLEFKSISSTDVGAKAQLTLTGQGFTFKKGKVLIGKKTATIVEWSDSSITLLVPVIKSGIYPIKIVTRKNGSVGASQVNIHLPKVNSLSSSSGSVGGTVIISGQYFGANKPKVLFITGKKSKKATVLSDFTDTSVQIKIPKKIKAGTYQVIVNNSAGSSIDAVSYAVQ